MPRTSNKAQLIVDYVNQFIQENGYSPSVREIGAAVGLRSTASVSYHLQALQEKGLLASPGAKGRKRAIVTTQRPGQIPVIGGHSGSAHSGCGEPGGQHFLGRRSQLLCPAGPG